MTNLIGNRVSRLVRERAYLSGELLRLEQAVRDAQERLDAQKVCLNRMLARIEDVDRSIRQFSGIDPTCIASIRATPKTGLGQFGDLRRTLVDILKEKKSPITTVEIIQRIGPVMGWDLATAHGRKKAREAVRKPLQIFKDRMVVERLPSHETAHRRNCGVWRWIGPPDTDNPAAQKKTADL